MELDAIIIPVRSLVDAATSRIVNEATAMYISAPWMNELSSGFEHWGHVPGGVVFALDPVDQARILATAFHEIIEYAVQNDIPLVLLDFPRFVIDSNYLFSQLSKVLELDEDLAAQIHNSLADLNKVRAQKISGALGNHQSEGILKAARERVRQMDVDQLDADVEEKLQNQQPTEFASATPESGISDFSGLTLFELIKIWYRSRVAKSRK